MDRKEYDQMAEELKPGGHKVKNGFNAFLYGGVMGAIAQGVLEFFMNVYNCSEKDAIPMMTITLVFVACLLTGLGLNMLEQVLLFQLLDLQIVWLQVHLIVKVKDWLWELEVICLN